MGSGSMPKHVVVVEPQPSPEIAALAERGLRINPSAGAVGDAAAIVIAVKPQVAAGVLPALKAYVGPSTVAVSIMAGRTLGFLEQALAAHAAVIRAMPNTPAAIGRGITVAVPNARVSPPQREFVQALLSATGAVEWIADEALMDAVTAVSGSGPAYVFLLAEALAQCWRGGGAAGRARSTACPRDRGRLRRTAAPLRRLIPQFCGRTSPRRAAPPQPRSTC